MKDLQYETWLVDEAKAGREYLYPQEARLAYEAAGYKWLSGDVMVNPTLNLNGTSGGELIRQLSEAASALRDAEKAMVDAGPHGRDYQHDVTGALYRAARAEHMTRLTMLRSLIHSYEEQMEHVDAQMLERESVRSARRVVAGWDGG